MTQITRRGFIQRAGSLPLAGAFCSFFGDQGDDPGPKGKTPMMTEPKLEHREKRHYVAIRTRVAMQELGTVIPQLLGEVFAWLGKQGITPAGAPIIRYNVIDMPARLDIEVGVPVATALAGNSRIHAGTLPAGRYATLVYTGVGNGVPANAALQEWGKKQGIKWQMRTTKNGTVWAARVEFFLTDPKQEPDREKWQTEVAYLTAENRAR
jgi:effector-binding domain-containing protein